MQKHECQAVRSPHSQKCYSQFTCLPPFSKDDKCLKGRLALIYPRTKPDWILTLAYRAKRGARVVIWRCVSLHCRLYVRGVHFCKSKISRLIKRHVHFYHFCVRICVYICIFGQWLDLAWSWFRMEK